MNNSSPLHRGLFLIMASFIAVLLVAAGGYYWTVYAPSHQTAGLEASLASGYATQALTSPFTLTGRAWQPASKQWVYTYSTALAGPDAVAAARDQLSRSAYQVNARRPDVVSAGTTTLYRDLITEDVSLKVQVQPSSVSSHPTLVTVTLTQLGAN